MDLELNGSTVVGWAVAAAVGFAMGAVTFYTPQPERRPQAAAPQAAPAARVAPQSSVTGGPAARQGEEVRSSASGAAVPFGASAPPSALAQPPTTESRPPVLSYGAAATMTTQPMSALEQRPALPPYGAAAGGGVAMPSSPAVEAGATASARTAVEASAGRFVAASNAPPAPVRPPVPVPVTQVGGYSLQGDTVLSVPPGADARRDYRMSIDVSKIP